VGFACVIVLFNQYNGGDKYGHIQGIEHCTNEGEYEPRKQGVPYKGACADDISSEFARGYTNGRDLFFAEATNKYLKKVRLSIEQDQTRQGLTNSGGHLSSPL